MTTTPNLPELKRLNIWVQEQDQLEPGARIWDQGNWVALREETPMCQTAYCVAGMAIARAGHTLSSKMIKLDKPSFDCFDSNCSGCDFCEVWTFRLDGQRVTDTGIQRVAAEILGLDDYCARRLFSGGNEAPVIDRVIRNIFLDANADYDSVEPAPDLEIEIKAAEAVRPQLLPELVR